MSSAAPRPETTYWRVRTPTVLQMEAVECGAAALAIIMGHYRKFVPLEILRQDCGVSRDGSKASHIVRAARQYGFEARGYRHEPATLLALGQPAIVFWNFNHFLVVEGVSAAGVHLNDPASGPRTVSHEEFDAGFTGVALLIAPGEAFVPGGDAPGFLPGLRQRLPLKDPALGYLVLAGLLLVIPGLVIPAFSRIFVDEFLIRHLDSWVKPLLIGMAATALLRGVLTWLQQHYLARFHTRLALASASRFFWHVLHLPVVFHAQRSAGDMASRVAINDRVAELLSGDFARTLLNLLVIVFYAALMFAYDPLLTLTGIAFAGLNVICLVHVARRRRDLNLRLTQDSGKLLGMSMNGLQMIETLKASGLESDFFARWSGQQAKVANALQQMGRQGILLVAAPALLTAINQVVLLGLGGLRVMDGVLTIGGLIAFQSLMSSFMQPIGQLVALGTRLQEMAGDLRRLDDVLHYPAETPAASPMDEEASPRLSGALELRQVSFGYSPLEAPLIEDFSLNLRPGMRVALVGPSGCGKSTIARLVMGLYPAWHGEILFDGQPRAAWRRETLAGSMAMVSQEISLFAGSVRDNLSLWDPTLGEAALLRAAQDACLHDLLLTRPGGYDAPVLEGGSNFSGGQRQRLEIARALAIDPRILVLDEATSALDPLTEQEIDDHLRRRGCTCLIVAHRLSTIRDCDEIIVLDRGRIVERGSHADLSQRAGPYARLMEAEGGMRDVR